MQHTKRWLALVLAVTMTLSDCGGMTALATENDDISISSISENNVEISEKFTSEDNLEKSDDDIMSSTFSDDTENKETGFEADIAVELPPLHIGQIKKDEDLPAPDDDEFAYDLPVSIDTSDCILLFVNYSLNPLSENGENGTLVWSILRGKQGMTPGSTSLINEEDDWTDFETVSSSPCFTMTVDKEKESGRYNMAEITVSDNAAQETYAYYIRAAYYQGTEKDKDEAFYAAATVPFLPRNTDTEETLDDTAALEDTPGDSISDNTTVAEDTVEEEVQEQETVDATLGDMDENDTDLPEDSGNPDQPSKSVSENSAAAEPVSVLAENSDENDDMHPTKNGVGVLTVSTENVTLHPTETISVSATIVPENISEPISWESDDQEVAIVDKNGKITAIAKGIALITAKCDDMTAFVRVNVVEADKNEVYDLSGDIWIAGFQKENESLVYTGQKVTQNFCVYYKETLLHEKTDYTLSYKNNINAAAWNAAKAPSVTVTMKGQYQGSVTLYYTIYPADIKGLDIYNPAKDNANENNSEEQSFSGYKQTVNYSKNLRLPTPELTFGKKKLAVNKDFVCDYTPLLAELDQQDY